jgi:glycosyltransferase involved in cell wall biosynthesis
MKILHILPTFCKGGGEKLVHDLANHQIGSGHQVEVLCFFNSEEQGLSFITSLDEGIPLLYITSIRQSKPLGNRFGHVLQKIRLYLLSLHWFFRNRSYINSFDIIHVHLTYGAFLGSLAYLFRGKSSSYKVIETNHTDSSSIDGLLKWFFYFNRKLRDAIIFELKESDYDDFKKNKLGIKSIFVPIGTSCPVVIDTQNVLERVAGKVSMGQVGRLHISDRRTDQYIHLVHALKKKLGDSFVFYLFGDGPDRVVIERMIKDYQLQNTVKLMGYTDDIAAALSSLDLYVTINVGPNCGVGGLQAMWFQVPTVAIQVDESYDTVSLHDVIPNSSDVNVLADHILQIIQHSDLQKQLVAQQYQHVVDYHSIDSYCQGTLDFYHVISQDAVN